MSVYMYIYVYECISHDEMETANHTVKQTERKSGEANGRPIDLLPGKLDKKKRRKMERAAERKNREVEREKRRQERDKRT